MKAQVGEYALVRAEKSGHPHKSWYRVRCFRSTCAVRTPPIFVSNGMGVYRAMVKDYKDGVYTIDGGDFGDRPGLEYILEKEFVDADELFRMALRK